MGKLIIFSGAGVSAESGLDTFRTDGGVWSKYDMDKVCNVRTWLANYELVHEFYNGRRAEINGVRPNAFHEAVARWSKVYEVVNLSQNIDPLFEQAGCENVIHLHGFWSDMKCWVCQETFTETGAWDAAAPCPICQSQTKRIKPGVVFFEENAPRYADLNRTLYQVEDDDIIIVAGTAEQVLPISKWLPWNGYKICVNPRIDAAKPRAYDRLLTMSATEAVPIIEQIIAERWAPDVAGDDTDT